MSNIITLEIENQDEVIKFFEDMPIYAKRAFKRGFDISGREQTDYIKKRMGRRDKTGNLYTRHVGAAGALLSKPLTHVASAPGESPSVITGALRGSVGYTVAGWDSMYVGAGSRDVQYAKVLEDGGASPASFEKVNFKGGFIQPRHYLKKSTRLFAPQVRNEINKQLNGMMKRKGMEPTR